MLTVHHLNNSRSQRVLWLLEELGVPYEIKHYQRDRKTMLAPSSLRTPQGNDPPTAFRLPLTSPNHCRLSTVHSSPPPTTPATGSGTR